MPQLELKSITYGMHIFLITSDTSNYQLLLCTALHCIVHYLAMTFKDHLVSKTEQQNFATYTQYSRSLLKHSKIICLLV